MTPEKCPLLADKQRIEDLTEDIVRAMRKMRADMRFCDRCKIDPQECLILQDLNLAVNEALTQITEEWNLVEIFKQEPCS